jgi:monovalent cation:H+ antiporter-2, CPA2 family
MEFEFFEDLTTILTAALVVAVVFSRIRLPSIIAYMIAGVLIGPYVLGLVEAKSFALVAEFGVVFLLFSLGLEFSLPRMLSLKGPVFGLGGAQVLVTTTVFACVVYGWGATIEAAIVVAGALALSSTAIVTRELAVSQQLDTRYAQLSVAVLLFQDMIAIVFLILVPVFARGEGGNVVGELGSALLRGVLLLTLLMSIGKWLLPRIYHEVSRARSDEVFLLTTLVIALLAAWLTHSVGLSMALGSFIIGMMLGEGPFRHKIDVEIRPFKDVLLGLFFVTIGMNVDLSVVTDHWLRIVLFTAVLVLTNISILAVLARRMGERHGDALKVGITLAQAGEFGLALLVVAELNGVVQIDQASFIIAIAVLSMLVSPLLIRHVHRISDWLLNYWPGASVQSPEVIAAPSLFINNHVIIGGFGRVGQTIAELLVTNDIPYIGIDGDAEVVRTQRLNGKNVIFGDCANSSILAQCHISSARLAILTFRSAAAARLTVQEIRSTGTGTPIIVRCYENVEFDELIALGADRVIPEMLEASLIISAQVLAYLGLEENEINRQINELRKPN